MADHLAHLNMIIKYFLFVKNWVQALGDNHAQQGWHIGYIWPITNI